MTLNKHLSYGLAISLVILLGLQWATMSFVFARLSEKQLVNRLSQDGESLLAGIAFDSQGAIVLDPQRVSAIYQRPVSGHYYLIVTDTQLISSRSLWDYELDSKRLNLKHLETGASFISRLKGPEQQMLLVLAYGYRKDQQNIKIVVAEDLAELQHSLRKFQSVYGLISLLILAILLLIQQQIVKRSLAPLEVMRENLSRLESGEATQIDSLGPAEIAPLTAEFNRLLNMMGNQSRRSREALGNLAHALKTQLAILNQTVEQSNTHNKATLTQTIYESTEIMRHIVERELKRARLVGSKLPGRKVNVQEELTLLIKTLQLIHVAKLPIISCEIDGEAAFIGDQEDFTELLGNLLDNACKWCKQAVHISVKQQQGVIFIIEDDGPSCEFEKLDALTRRGFRLDESTPGSGLGLAIVHDIVESYHGTLSFDQSSKFGGLRVTVWLPNSA